MKSTPFAAISNPSLLIGVRGYNAEMARQKTIVVIIACVVVAIAFLFLAIPCTVTAFMVFKHHVAEAEARKMEKELQERVVRP